MAAVALFLLAVAGYALLVHAYPQYYWRQIDTAVYRDGGITVRNQPSMLYALRLGPAKLPFIYPPFAALLLAAGSGASFATWQVGLAVLTIGLLPAVTYLSLGLAGRPAGLARAAAAFAIAAVGLWLEPVAMTLFFGQINLVLLALVVGDLALPDRVKGKGIGIGLAAAIKLTPLIFIPYLLFTRRVKTAAVSALTFAVTVGLGFVLLPHASAVFWHEQFTQLGSKHFHLDNQSLNGVILRLTHAGPDAHAFWQVAAVVVGIAGLATSILASRHGHELLGLVACAATGLLVSPISWSHHYVYVIPALVLAAYGPRRIGYRILGAALVVGLFGWWPLPIGSQGGYDPKAQLLPRGLLLLAPNEGNNGAVEFTWRGLELIVGNSYVLTLLVFIAATACALVLTRRLRPERAAPALLTDLPPSSQGRGTRQRGMRFRRTTRSRRDRTVLPAWPRESPPTDGA
jgi:alpha-1,2-mannosyltransferase